MLLDLSVRLEEGLPLPSPVDMGAILVLILRSKDLGFGGSDDILTNFLEIARIRAELVKENVRQNVPEAYAESGRLDAALTLWIQSQSDLDSEGIARMGLE
jgi:hypothetical protein